MERNIQSLTEREYDLVIVGGGIFGICAAWDAASRGLSVAILEKGDWAHSASANCFRIVHGGIRYLQHADIYRIRESSRERRALLRIAPHQVRPLPIVIPTYGHGMKGKEILKAALLAYDLITFDRNRGLDDPRQHIHRGHLLSLQECLRMFPGLKRNGLTGAAMFYDGQMYSTTQLALSFLKSAIKAGADAANYMEVSGLIQKGDRVTGVTAMDRMTGEKIEVRGKVVLNAAGSWAPLLLNGQRGIQIKPEPVFSRDTCFIVPRRLAGDCALAVQGRTEDPDAILSRGERHLFIVPWRDYTLIGVWHVVYKGSPDWFTVTERELQAYLDEINEAYPILTLTMKDISMWNAGLVLFGNNRDGSVNLSYGKRSILIDHAKKDRLEGLITLIGVRYTTARGVAARAIDLVFKKMGKKGPASRTDITPIHGGNIENFEDFVNRAIRENQPGLSEESIRSLVHHHGSEYPWVLKYIEEYPGWADTIGTSHVIKAEIVYAVREEMARKLGDVVLRRTDLGAGEYPGETALKTCAEIMGKKLGWNELRIKEEMEEVKKSFLNPV